MVAFGGKQQPCLGSSPAWRLLCIAVCFSLVSGAASQCWSDAYGTEDGAQFADSCSETGNAEVFQSPGFLDFTGHPSVPIFGDDLSFAARVYATGNPSWSRIFDFGDAGNIYSVNLGFWGSTDKMSMDIFDTFRGNLISSTAWPFHQWVHVAVTLEAISGSPGRSTAIMYMDGVEVARSVGMPTPTRKSRARHYIAKDLWGGNHFWRGEISQFIIYPRALTGSEVSDLSDGWILPGSIFSLGCSTPMYHIGECVDACVSNPCGTGTCEDILTSPADTPSGRTCNCDPGTAFIDNVCVDLNPCGDNIVGGEEECDDGEANTLGGPSGSCKGDCTLQIFGDSDLGSDEECDDGNH